MSEVAEKAPEAQAREPRFWSEYMQDVPLCQELMARYTEIRDEVTQFIAKYNPLRDYPSYKYVNPVTNQVEDSIHENEWKAFPYTKFEGKYLELNPAYQKFDMGKYVQWVRGHCKVINEIITPYEEKGYVANGFVSKTAPGTVIKPHRGWSNKFLRCHLGLICDPACAITVGDETQVWEEGKMLAFIDGGIFPHSVLHKGTSERIVLSIDILISDLKDVIPGLYKQAQKTAA